MSIINFGGFEEGVINNVVSSGTQGDFSLVTSPVRSGAGALRINPVGSGTGFIEQAGVSASGDITQSLGFSIATEYTIKTHFRYATKPGNGHEPVLGVYDVNYDVHIWFISLTSDGKLSLWGYDTDIEEYNKLGDDSAAVLSADTWYEIAVTWAGAGNHIAVTVDGAVVLSEDFTYGYDDGEVGWLKFGKFQNISGQSVDFFYDDWLIEDSATPSIDRPFGVVGMLPVANGTYTGWTALSGDKYACIDEAAYNSDTDYIIGAIADEAYTATIADPAAAGATGAIRCAKGLIVRKGLVGSAKCVLYSDAFTVESTALASGGYKVQAVLSAIDPSTTYPWVLAGLAAAQIGARVGDAGSQRVTWAQIQALFTPSLAFTDNPSAGLGVGAVTTRQVAAGRSIAQAAGCVPKPTRAMSAARSTSASLTAQAEVTRQAALTRAIGIGAGLVVSVGRTVAYSRVAAAGAVIAEQLATVFVAGQHGLKFVFGRFNRFWNRGQE